MRKAWPMALLAGTIACAPNPVVGFTGTDGGKPDAGGRPDAGRRDAGADAGPVDAGPDGGATDAGDGGFDSGFDAGFDGGPLTGTVCPAGSTPVVGFTLDLCASTALGAHVPLPGVQVATLQPYGAALSDGNGNYSLCVPPDAPVTLVFTIAGYVTMYEAEISVSGSLATILASNPILGEMDIACDAAIQSYSRQLPLYDTSDAAVYSVVLSARGFGTTCDPTDAGYSGWSLRATMIDGGAGPGGPWPTAYFDDSGGLQSLAASFSNGQVFMYNIDPSIGFVSVTGSNPALQSVCGLLDPLVFTGRIYVAPSAFSFYPWVMP